MPRRRPPDPEIYGAPLRIHTGPLPTDTEEIAPLLHTLDSLKARISGCYASDVSCLLNHIGIAERSLGAVHRMLSTLGTVPLDRFYFSRKGGPPSGGSPPRAV
jgi:hypothetical protein